TGCGQSAPLANADAGTNAAPAYPTPPELTGVAKVAGGLQLSGVAMPNLAVRLATPSGAAGLTNADADGRWRFVVPASGSPRLFSLSMAEGGRVVQAAGYLFVAPGGVATKLRAGGGSALLDGGASLPSLQTLDYDDKGAATLAGRAGPGETLSLRVDGVERAQGQASADGRFVLALNMPLTDGDHDFDLASPTGEVEVHASINRLTPLGTSLFAATPVGGGWRVDWLTPGGGEQTTVILGPPAPRT
ncbi:MAG TPA: hypothetical protein VME40_13620, partial [Caulobacteraceae bacterium]|nr:hypothetical protein [Caulobacteraceae bacterium]